MTTHRRLDGAGFIGLFLAGCRHLADGREYLDSINVFPVPDGDTGTNMAETVNRAAETLHDIDDRSLPHVLETLSHKLRMEAKGNSGIILSEFFHGMFGVLKDGDHVDPANFVPALRSGKDAAYGAVANPREGTILTVIRKTVERLTELQAEIEDMKVLLQRMVDDGRIALHETKEEMTLLHDNDVVDSGAHGFLLFWEGALAYLKGDLVTTALKPIRRVFRAEAAEITFRYCTEGLVEGNADREQVRAALTPLGDSLIVSGDGGLTKIHVHTNDPERVFTILRGFGTLVKTKADDMKAQHQAKVEAQRRPVGIVTDSTCDLDLGVREAHGIEMAPLVIRFGDDHYRDRVDMTPEEFYRRMTEPGAPLPTTSLPSGESFLSAYGHLAPRADHLLGIFLSSSLSGTWQAGKKWGEEFSGRPVTVFDSRQASLGMGMMVLEAARMADAGAPLDEIMARLEQMRDRMRTYLTVGSLDHLARNGRIGKARCLIGKTFGMRPILGFIDGEVRPVTKGIGRKGMLNRLIGLLEKDAARPGFEGHYGMVWSDDESIKEDAMALLEQRLPVRSMTVAHTSPVIGAHVGPGTLGVFCY